MEQIQIEELVAELETRVDRLRSLYEQYFMGIEKMEPLVPKKDIERRFQTLRREQIRNTALRFRFQMVLQKYNTYQSYWMRIMRQIEDGTYKRDVLRAKAAFGERRSTRPPPRVVEIEDTENTVDVDTFELDDQDFPVEVPTRKVDVPAVGKAADLFDPFDEATTRALTKLPDEEDLTGVLPLVDGPQKPVADAKPKLARPQTADAEKMRLLAAQIKAKKAAEGTPQTKEPAPPPRRMVAEAPPIHAAPPNAAASSAAGPPKKAPPLPPRPGAPAAPTVASAAQKPAPPPAQKPAAPPAPRPAAPAAAPSAPKPPIPAPRTATPGTKPAAPTALAKPIIPPPAAAKPEAPKPAAPKPASPADLSDARVRQIYTQYVDTKRKQNESTATITYEGVAKSLRESTARLKEKHGGKQVDFEVTVKDGKTILRPVVK